MSAVKTPLIALFVLAVAAEVVLTKVNARAKAACAILSLHLKTKITPYVK
jgi:hypothetical protein